jgi:hypothetical protein
MRAQVCRDAETVLPPHASPTHATTTTTTTASLHRAASSPPAATHDIEAPLLPSGGGSNRSSPRSPTRAVQPAARTGVTAEHSQQGGRHAARHDMSWDVASGAYGGDEGAEQPGQPGYGAAEVGLGLLRPLVYSERGNWGWLEWCVFYTLKHSFDALLVSDDSVVASQLR